VKRGVARSAASGVEGQTEHNCDSGFERRPASSKCLLASQCEPRPTPLSLLVQSERRPLIGRYAPTLGGAILVELGIQPGQGADISRNCDGGQQILGGGVAVDTQTTAVQVESSHPQGNGWDATVFSSSGAPHDVRVEALCLKK
jgi:hypothetical protein